MLCTAGVPANGVEGVLDPAGRLGLGVGQRSMRLPPGQEADEVTSHLKVGEGGPGPDEGTCLATDECGTVRPKRGWFLSRRDEGWFVRLRQGSRQG